MEIKNGLTLHGRFVLIINTDSAEQDKNGDFKKPMFKLLLSKKKTSEMIKEIFHSINILKMVSQLQIYAIFRGEHSMPDIKDIFTLYAQFIKD